MAVGSTPNGGHKPMCADLSCQMFSCMCMHLLIRTPIVHTGMHPIAPQSTLVVTLVLSLVCYTSFHIVAWTFSFPMVIGFLLSMWLGDLKVMLLMNDGCIKFDTTT